jgi:hypothetical protein
LEATRLQLARLNSSATATRPTYLNRSLLDGDITSSGAVNFSLDDTQIEQPQNSSRAGAYTHTPHPSVGNSLFGVDSTFTDVPRHTASVARPIFTPKISPPEKFYGRADTTAMQLLGYMNQMEIYLLALGVKEESAESLTHALLTLRDDALMWYQAYKKRNVGGLDDITCWKNLKQELIKRYQPADQEQTSMDQLLNISYRDNINRYNNDFNRLLTQIPSLNDPQVDTIVQRFYLKGLQGSGSTYLLTAVRTAMSGDRKCRNVMELMRHAAVAESNLKASRTSAAGSSAKVSSGRRNYYVPPPRFPSASRSYPSPGYRYSTPPRPSFSSRFSGSPSVTPRPSNFASPGQGQGASPRVHLMEGDQTDEVNGEDESEEISQDLCTSPELHQVSVNWQEEMADGAGNGQNECELNGQAEEKESETMGREEMDPASYAVLQMVQQYEQTKQRNPNMSPEEFAELKKKNACYLCKRNGHYAKECPSRARSGNNGNTFNQSQSGNRNGFGQPYQRFGSKLKKR